MPYTEQKKFPEMTTEQFALLQKQIDVKIEVDSYEKAIIQADGEITYERLNEEHCTGYFEGVVFGVHFQTDRTLTP